MTSSVALLARAESPVGKARLTLQLKPQREAPLPAVLHLDPRD
jgi:hypothetical protein